MRLWKAVFDNAVTFGTKHAYQRMHRLRANQKPCALQRANENYEAYFLPFSFHNLIQL